MAEARWHASARTSVGREFDECLREITRVYECWAGCLKQDLQDLLGLGFIGIFGMVGAMLAQRSYERMTSDGERLREITRVYKCWADCLKRFAGSIGIFGMAGAR